MEVIVHGLNMKVSESIESYARKKLDRLDRYLPGITDVRLEIGRQNSKRNGNVAIAQLTVRHRRGAILRAEERASGELEVAINLAVDKMYRRIERFKGKRVARAKGRFAASTEELNIAEEIPEIAEVEPEQPETGIVRRKSVNVVAMTEEEAVEQMELLGHTFFMFYNGATGSINVVYKRAQGGYGLLVPQVE